MASHVPSHDLEQFVEVLEGSRWGRSRRSGPWGCQEVRLPTGGPVLQHLVELGEHVLGAGEAFGETSSMAPAIWLNQRWASCSRNCSSSSSKRCWASDDAGSRTGEGN